MLVPAELQKGVAFIGYEASEGVYTKLGTAFFVSYRTNETTFGYVVTAKHIIAKIKEKRLTKAHLRVNTHFGFRWVETDLNSWRSHPDDYRIDVSVLALALPLELFDFQTLPISMAATDRVIDEYSIGLGNEVFMVGLFSQHTGKKKNLPIVRIGNIALMPDEPVEVSIMGMRETIEAYLIEARSIGGLSGSPVYVRTDFVISSKPTPPTTRTVFWLGLIHGHWDIPVKADDIEQDEDSTPLAEKVNMGVAIVVPVTQILEVINQDFFAEKRRQRIEELQRNNLATPDIAGGDIDGSFNREDFN